MRSIEGQERKGKKIKYQEKSREKRELKQEKEKKEVPGRRTCYYIHPAVKGSGAR